MAPGRHARRLQALSLPRALMIAGAGYLVLGVVWYGAWFLYEGAPSDRAIALWGHALLAPLAFLDGLIAWRFAERSLLRFALAHLGVLTACVIFGYVGIATGALLGWFLLWTFLEPRAIPFLAFWWPAVWLARVRLRRLWLALA